MTMRAPAIAFLACVLVMGGCDYVVLPPEDGAPAAASGKGWSAVATSVGPGGGGLEVALTIHNETGAWSAMQAIAGRPAALTTADGKSADCATVIVGTGGHRLAPGLRMRGFVAGSGAQPTTELIRVGCAGAEASPGSRLTIEYSYVTGEYNYYAPDANRVNAKLEVKLDDVASGLDYPIAERIDGVIVARDVEITAINDVVLTLTAVERTATSLKSTWHTSNPGAYPSYVHIGNPPVIGSDGILYGIYESPDIASVPVTPAAGQADWTTEVAVPADVSGLYMMLSVESKKQRLFVNYAIDLSDD